MSLKGQPIVPVHIRGIPVQGTHQEKHIVLPLSNNLPRIPLLPGSSSTPSSQQSTKVSLHLGNQVFDKMISRYNSYLFYIVYGFWQFKNGYNTGAIFFKCHCNFTTFLIHV